MKSERFEHSKKSGVRVCSLRQKIFSLALLILSPAAAFYCLEWMTHNPWAIMPVHVQIWNILFYEMVYLLIFFLTRKVKTAVSWGSALFLVIGLLEYFVMEFRSSPVVPWDIFSIRTAASVASNYQYTITLSCGIAIAVYIGLIVAGRFCRYELRRGIAGRRVVTAALICVLAAGYTLLLHQDSFVKFMGLDATLFTPYYMAKKDGFTTAFLLDLKYLTVDVPEGYSAEEAQERLAGYEEETEAEKTPNIIVIMDEAFSDPSVLGDFTVNMDYMPYIHSLEEGADNTRTGYLNVSVKGGNTANTEYEFLTGNSMRFLPGGSIPYQQYIFHPKYSLVSWLESLGYATASVHPYNSTGWNRDRVYAYFGFDDILFNTDFVNPQRIRKYISDEACFDKIIELYENTEKGTPLFCFAVTMQNHGGYSEDFDNFTVDVHAEEADSERLDRYLSLVKLTDEALEEFIGYFSEAEEDTVIVFFGDHQPNDNVVESLWKLQGKSGTTLDDEDEDLRYKVPFVIWANFDMEESTGEEISVNYLAASMLQAAGLPLSAYQQYLMELSETYPVVSTQRLADAAGEDTEDAAALEEYNRLQYYEMYDNDRPAD